MRRKLAIANWKMNFERSDAVAFVEQFEVPNLSENTSTILCVPAVFINELQSLVKKQSLSASIGAQNVSQHKSGAYTGEISADMLASLDVKYCIVGHSERRAYFNENSQTLIEKIKQLHQREITPILCVGESLDVREAEAQNAFVAKQITEIFDAFTPDETKKWIIAYEPVWAIGTGKTASPEQAEEMHQSIRTLITQKYGASIADTIPILYGGSVKADNALELFSCANIDGALVGGASLIPSSFSTIIAKLVEANK